MTADTFQFPDNLSQLYSRESYKFSNNSSIRRIKRKNEQQNGFESSLEPLRKRPVYEERMSNKLCNFHINDSCLNTNESQIITDQSIEEISDWEINDIEVDNSSNLIVEDPLEEMPTSSKIYLSDQLKSFIDCSKNVDEFAFLKEKNRGKELVLYRPYVSPAEIIESLNGLGDIQNRIIELQNVNDFDEGQNPQTVSFPDDSSSSISCIDSGSSSSNISLNGWDISNKESSNEHLIVNNDYADPMDVD